MVLNRDVIACGANILGYKRNALVKDCLLQFPDFCLDSTWI